MDAFRVSGIAVAFGWFSAALSATLWRRAWSRPRVRIVELLATPLGAWPVSEIAAGGIPVGCYGSQMHATSSRSAGRDQGPQM